VDSTDKLEIGRYDLASAGSKSAFFSVGVMYAAFIFNGTTPCSRDQQDSRLRNGAKMSTLNFSTCVGIGSDKHCLPGSARTISDTSAGVTGVEVEFTTNRCSSVLRRGGVSSSSTNTSNLVVKELVQD